MQTNINLIIIIISAGLAIMLFYSILQQWDIRKKKIKYLLTLTISLCASGAILHTYNQSILYAKNIEFQQAFDNKETLICIYNNETIHVHKTTFIYFPDLLSFFGKNELKGTNIPIANCTQHIIMQSSDLIND